MSREPIPSDALFITPAQCARLLQKPVEHVLQLIAAGRLPAIDVGLASEREWLIARHEIWAAHREDLPAHLDTGDSRTPEHRPRLTNFFTVTPPPARTPRKKANAEKDRCGDVE